METPAGRTAHPMAGIKHKVGSTKRQQGGGETGPLLQPGWAVNVMAVLRRSWQGLPKLDTCTCGAWSLTFLHTGRRSFQARVCRFRQGSLCSGSRASSGLPAIHAGTPVYRMGQTYEGVTQGEPFQKDARSGSSRPDPGEALGVGPGVLVSRGRESAERLS